VQKQSQIPPKQSYERALKAEDSFERARKEP